MRAENVDGGKFRDDDEAKDEEVNEVKRMFVNLNRVFPFFDMKLIKLIILEDFTALSFSERC